MLGTGSAAVPLTSATGAPSAVPPLNACTVPVGNAGCAVAGLTVTFSVPAPATTDVFVARNATFVR